MESSSSRELTRHAAHRIVTNFPLNFALSSTKIEHLFYIESIYSILEVKMPIMTEEHLEARRMQILKAATKCFAEKGFKRTTMRDICRAAKLSPGAVYNYFSGKEKIIDIIAQASIEENRDRIISAAKSDNPLAGVAKAFISLAKDPAFIPIIGFNFNLLAESRINPKIAKSLSEIICTGILQLAKFVRME